MLHALAHCLPLQQKHQWNLQCPQGGIQGGAGTLSSNAAACQLQALILDGSDRREPLHSLGWHLRGVMSVLTVKQCIIGQHSV